MRTSTNDGSLALSDLNADDVRSLIVAIADLAILTSPSGAVQEVFGRPETVQTLDAGRWRGKSLDEVMDPACARKLRQSPPISTNPVRVSYSTPDGDDIEFAYSPVLLGSSGCTLMVGRDESRVAALQYRLLEQHRTAGERLENQKHSEAQYRKLFTIGAEPVMVVDGDAGKIADMNASAAALLDVDPGTKIGRQFSTLVQASDRSRLRALFAAAAATRATEAALLTLASGEKVTIRATRGPGDGAMLLIQLDASQNQSSAPDESQKGILDLIRLASEAVVIVDEQGVIGWANAAFADMVRSGSGAGVVGQNLETYLDAKDLDLGVVLANLRRHGEIKQLPAAMRNAAGDGLDVELSAVTIAHADGDEFGFSIRRVTTQATATDQTGGETAIDALWGQLGKAPLRELVNEEIAGVEKNLIRAALDLNKGNRSATARLLGLSRQSLYSKLERYGISSGD